MLIISPESQVSEITGTEPENDRNLPTEDIMKERTARHMRKRRNVGTRTKRIGDRLAKRPKPRETVTTTLNVPTGVLHLRCMGANQAVMS